MLSKALVCAHGTAHGLHCQNLRLLTHKSRTCWIVKLYHPCRNAMAAASPAASSGCSAWAT